MEKELEEYINDVLTVCSSRAAFVINHILANGSINSDDIADAGFVHGARAVGDVRDNGVPLNTEKTKSREGKNIARYVFGSAAEIKRHKFGGRVNFPKALKQQLIDRDGLFCAISNQEYAASELTIDHRIPYYIAGDIQGDRDPNDFMLLSKSMQRAKSWDCENCKNIKEIFDVEICRSCYWAYPEEYTHVAMKQQRNLSITWFGDEVDQYTSLSEESQSLGCSPQTLIKDIVKTRYEK